MTGGTDPAEPQAARVLVGPHPGQLVLWVVRALGLAGQQLGLGQDHVLCVLNVRNAAPAGQLDGRVVATAAVYDSSSAGRLALGTVDVVEEILAELGLRVGKLSQLGGCGRLGEIQLQVAGLAEGGGLLVVLLRLVELVHQVVGVGQVGQVLLHGAQVARAHGPLQDLAPVLLRETFDVRPRGGVSL